ncbi:unnamed protein product [Cuscuta campestris]|uniref:Leucine-rich repeat-containing N-terminal plant-type domain-containing protein n=1 Tax=Cuscuta campestris TaxID=132261 RepID=A0A484L228_9ASTE|nr:unnamed protein product [Cuscuta campestris]
MASKFFSSTTFSSCHHLLFIFISLLLLLHCVTSSVASPSSQHKTQTSKITLGGETLPPPSPPSSTYNAKCGCHLPTVDPVIAQSIEVITKFKKVITNDPNGVTKTWRGNELCVNSAMYRGFHCYVPKGGMRHRVGGINFNGFNLDGNHMSLNGFIDSFQDLAVIHINSNNFTAGQSPLGISASKLPTLFELDLSNNKLAGEFPTAVLEANNLTFLDLRFNMLTGPIPPKVFTLDLDALFLNNNGFTGSIPQNLGSTPAFFLSLANNKLTGPIPKSIGSASKTMTEVLFLNNKLSGCLPYEIGLLKNASIFDASTNMLTGPLPQSLGCLGKMEILNLKNNELYGTVPESLCKLKYLEELSLSNNYFTQIGPNCRQLLEKKILDIENNCVLDLPNQRSATECKMFFKQARKCPDPRSMLYVPCEINEVPKMEELYHHQQKLKRGSSRTYKTLDAHRHR